MYHALGYMSKNVIFNAGVNIKVPLPPVQGAVGNTTGLYTRRFARHLSPREWGAFVGFEDPKW